MILAIALQKFMQGNKISKNVLQENAIFYLKKLQQTMTIKEYGLGSIKSYVNEMTLLFKYYHHKRERIFYRRYRAIFDLYKNSASSRSS
ncbi:MAG: hypothetical protein IPQ10_04735 [Saprospiraceae bacterium]|nr:hypothetical protein [Saprospiraceae bacterium]